MTIAVRQKLEAAMASHQAGKLREAEQLYRHVLRRDPRQHDALHLLGLLRHQQGDHIEAARSIEHAIQIRPDIAVYYENLAAVQRARNDFSAIVETCRRGIRHAPTPSLHSTLAEALLVLGYYREALLALDELDILSSPTDARLADRALCLLHLGRSADAIASAKEALRRNPGNANAAAVLADAATQSGQHELAAENWRKALRIAPSWVAAAINLGLSLIRQDAGLAALDVLEKISMPADPALAAAILNGRAAAHRNLAQVAKAEQMLRCSLVIAPDATEAWSNLSDIYRTGSAADALRFADRALACDGLNSGAASNRALALADLGDLSSAVAMLRRSITISPSDAMFLNNLADPVRWFGNLDTAMKIYRRVLAIDPHHAPAGYGLGTAYLSIGDLEQGWRGFESRFKGYPSFANRPFTVPRWSGEALGGRLLVWGEQGLGDEIIYGTMLPDLAAKGIAAVVECDRRMVSLFSRSIPSLEFVARIDPPDPRLLSADVSAQEPIASLARRYRRRQQDFPSSRAYLTPRPDLVARYRRLVDEIGPGPKIGFAWRSRRIDAMTSRYHPPVQEWVPLLSRPRATFVSLQYGDVDDDLQQAERLTGSRIHRIPGLDLMNDLEGVLALSSVLDLVISTQTTAYCFPASVGTPVWILAPEIDYFRLGTRDACLWFPSARVYPHPYTASWSDTIGRIAGDFDRRGLS